VAIEVVVEMAVVVVAGAVLVVTASVLVVLSVVVVVALPSLPQEATARASAEIRAT